MTQYVHKLQRNYAVNSKICCILLLQKFSVYYYGLFLVIIIFNIMCLSENILIFFQNEEFSVKVRL